MTRPTRPQSDGILSRRLFTIAPFVLVAVGSAAAGVLVRVPSGTIAPGLHVAGVALGGKTTQEARQTLATHLARFEKTPVVLRFEPESGIKRTWRASARELGLTVDTDATLQSASRVEPPGTFQRLASFVTRNQPQQEMAPVAAADNKKLRAVLQQIGAMVNRKPKNARLTVLNGGFNINHDQPGFAMDVNASAEAVVNSWKQFLGTNETPEATPPSTDAGAKGSGQDPQTEGQTQKDDTAGSQETQPKAKSLSEEGIEATLVGKVTQAPVTAVALKDIDGMIGAFSTHFGGTGLNRGGNIALAASKINGTLLAPGEIFSYNKTVGPRVASEGFRLAPVIVNNQLVPGIGGGICQVSTTLYNAALLADLKIVRRSHHAFPVHYIPAGRDATVAYGSLDLQFQNNTEAPLYINSAVKGGRITFRLFGKTAPTKKVSLITTGGVSRTGGRAATLYRVVKENGEVVRRERISSDSYNPPPSKPRKKPVVKPTLKPAATAKPGTPATPAPGGAPTAAPGTATPPAGTP